MFSQKCVSLIDFNHINIFADESTYYICRLCFLVRNVDLRHWEPKNGLFTADFTRSHFNTIDKDNTTFNYLQKVRSRKTNTYITEVVCVQSRLKYKRRIFWNRTPELVLFMLCFII